MKKVLTMNVIRKNCLRLAFGLSLILFSLPSCENPFRAGLGPVVDIRPPTIVLYDPEVDTFIRGVVTFTGFAEDDFRLTAVYIKVVNYPDLAANPWPDWTPVDILKKDGNWTATIDTVGFDPLEPIFPDGDFKIRLKAVDSVGKWAGDEDIVFQLKNRPPIVSLTLPSVTEGTNAGELGGTKINYGWAGDFTGDNGIFPAIRILDTGAVVTGMIRDNEGVVLETASAVIGDDGVTVAEKEKRPPQFRFWRVSPNPDNPNDRGGFRPGVYPSETQVPWERFIPDYEDPTADSSIMEIGANEYLFMHKIPQDSDRYYAFEVRVQSKDGTEFLYPMDYRAPSWWASSAVPDTTKNENRYVLFYARLPQEYPTLDLYQLQDIFREDAWNADATPPKYDDIPGIDPVNDYHPYTNTTAVFKNGAFTLRVKASHSRFVEEARVFWERSDKTAKGLFIWDPANKTPYPGWNSGNNISTGRTYEQWGYYDSNQKDTRNFIFTYSGDEASDTIPNTSDYHESARGKYKIQKYIGSEQDWKNDKAPSSWVDYTNPNQQKGKKLEEGSYEISGETVNGNSLISKYLCTITIDEEGPEVSLNGIDGSLDDGTTDGSKPYTVNGVVRPRIRIFDARARDSGLRPAPLDADYYRRANGRTGDELRYMLIRSDDKAKMDAYLGEARWNGNPWPSVPNVIKGSSYQTIYQTIYEKPYTDAGITIYKNGPILDGSLMFKATKIYEGSVSEDVLEDGNYLLYALARDNAFNVTWASYPIKVDAASDIPVFEFTNDPAISEDVTNPSVSADRTDSITGNGFVVGDGSGGRVIRNKFGANTDLLMRLGDDDSLDLGDTRPTDLGNSGIVIRITGASSDSAGNVTPYNNYVMQLTREDILGVFLGQQLDGTTRRPVRDRRGTVTQAMLLDRIKGNHLPPGNSIHTDPAHPYNRLFGTVDGDTAAQIKEKKEAYQGRGLPEGIYRISVSVGDYPPAKLRLPWENDPLAATKEKTIWIAVDNTPPSIDRDSILPKEGDFLSAGESIKITGTVSDKNGPVTIKSFTSIPNLNLKPQDIDITYRQTGTTGLWEADFSAPINLGGSTGAFTFIFEFQDRFGNTNQPFQIRYSADDEPPVVSLSTAIRTFERDYEDVKLHDPKATKAAASTDSENKLRLTNGVVSFVISATDNSGTVAGLRWWLLPAVNGSTVSGLNTSGTVTDFNAYPFSPTPPAKGAVNYLPNGGAYGELDPENRPFRVYLDTEKLHGDLDGNLRGGDGEYRLHVIAVDPPGSSSRNPSNANWPGTCIMQSIYVLQEQDRPYFFEFAPASKDDVVDSLIITGTITDDHGFDDLADSVFIWLSNVEDPPDPAAYLTEGAGNAIPGYGPRVPVKEEHLTRSGKTTVNVKINLNAYPEFGTISNGPKHYIIESTDSRLAKINDDGTPAGDTHDGKPTRRSRRQHYAFAYDDRDPKIELSSPTSGASFGVTAGSIFNLQGYIEDAYLKKTDDDYYYIKFSLDDGPTGTWEFRDPNFGLGSVGPSPDPLNGTRVNFNIPSGRVTGAQSPNLFNFGNLSPGSHKLTLIVEDQSRKTASAVLYFIKDTLPPDFTFTNIEKRSVSPQDLPSATIRNWWTKPGALSETEWYENKRNWLTVNPVSVIYYDTGVPELTGTFTDETSDIKTDSIRFLFDNAPDTDWGGLDYVTIDGAGRNIRWTIYLTDTGLPNGTPLTDGIHTIRFTVADVCGNILYDDPTTAVMYAFRIVSSARPEAKIIIGTPATAPRVDITGYGHNVFGNANGFTNANGFPQNLVFTVVGTAESANLKDVRLMIVETSNRNTVLFNKYLIEDSSDPTVGINTSTEWEYDTAGSTLNPPKVERIKWTYNITKTLYNNSGTGFNHGTSYDIIAVAVNQNKTESDEAVWTFTPDMESPVVTFAGNAKTNDRDLNPEQLRDPAVSTFEVIRSQSLKVQGGVADGVSRITALEYKIWKWNYSFGTTGRWEVIDPVPNPNSGWQNIPGFDAATNTSTDVNWTIDLPTFTEGLYRIKVQAKDASYIRDPTAGDRLTTPPERIGEFNPGGTGNPVTSDYMYFFYDRFGPVGFDPKVDSFYSSRKDGGTIVFEGDPPYSVTDPNRIRSVSVTVIDGPEGRIPAGMTSTPWTPANANAGPETQEWKLTLRAPFEGGTAVPDGRYQLEFVAEDMAGNVSKITRSFTLDNTRPIGTVILPDKRQPAVPGIPDYASIVVIGGQAGEITGETSDPSENKAESGVKAMWYHLGYINPFTEAAPTNAATYTTFFNNNRVWEDGLPVGINRDNDTGANDAVFDAAAKANGNTWFKYAPNTVNDTWPVPTGFIVNLSTPNIYDWRMELPHIYPVNGLPDTTFGNSSSLDPATPNADNPRVRGGFKQYAYPIRIKGANYNDTGLRRMTVPVPEAIAGQGGVVSMPMWLRVVDNAGNVSYSCRDIWIYPDGDIPSTSILNPENATGTGGARAGSISSDGVAANITSIYSVIYRIKADNVSSPTSATVPPDTQIIRFDNGATEVTAGNDTPEYDKIPTPLLYPNSPDYKAGGGWYRANLEVARGEPIAPWNFLFNTGNEITDKITAWGFPSTGSGSNDMIRVYMEVFVFSGSIAPEQISVANGTKALPRPYVRTFFLKVGAPRITGVMVSTVNQIAGETYLDPEDQTVKTVLLENGIYYEAYRTGLAPRRGRFYVRAELDASNGQSLSQITLRRPNNETDTGYQVVWEDSALQGVQGATVTPLPAQQRHVIRYAMDSTATASTNDFAAVRNGGWRNSGGRYGLEIRIRDNSNPPGEISRILEVGIDNFAPVADPNIYSSKKAAGSAVDFIGRVYDYQGSPNISDGMPRKVEKVYVWFTKTINGQTNYVNFNTGATQLATGNSGTRNDIYLNRNAVITKNGDTVTNITIPATGVGAPGAVTYPLAGGTFNVAGGWVKEISETTAAVYGSGMTWIPTNEWDIQWVFRADTTKMPDGRITLNYVVVDSAGNASFYTQDEIYIRNKYPEISRVTLYTDNNGVGAVYTTHDTNSVASTEFELRDSNGDLNYDNSRGYLNSGFISKNRFIGFKVETLLGNAPLSYRLQYVTRQSIQLNAANLQQMVNDRNGGAGARAGAVNLYTIDETGDYSNNSWAMLGVNVSNPPPGTHFVFTPDTLTPEMTRSDSARVWRYTTTTTLTRTPPAGQPGTTGGVNNPVLPNEPNNATEPGHGFNFSNNGGRTDFGGANGIGEFSGSHPDEDEKALDEPGDTAFFLIKVWDSVNDSATATETDQLYDAVVIGMNVYLNDNDSPVSRLYDLNPYTEAAVTGNNIGTANQQATIRAAIDPKGIGENILRGGLFNTGTSNSLAKSGHIEPRNNTTALMPQVKTAGNYVTLTADGFTEGDSNVNATFTRDQVSGKVILRGVAWDNQLIREIRVRIGTEADGDNRAILRLDLTGNMQTNPNFRTIQPVNGAQAWAVEEMHWKTGHTVEWAYIWDTETRPNANGTPAGDVPVYVTVVDQLGTAATNTSPEVTLTQESVLTETFHNRVNVDIVPYVSYFERDSRFATKRSRQGWYSFYQGETGIRAVGFNLGTGNGTTMRLYTSATANITLPVSAQSRNSVTFSIPDTATSGKIVLNTGVTVNGSTEALNHRTAHNTKSWNREYHPFTDGSDLWLNKSYAHIWRSNHQTSAPVTFFAGDTATTGSWELQRPGMALEYTGGNAGRLTGAWAVYAQAGVYWGYNTNTNRSTIYNANGEPYAGTDISFYNGATANGSIVLALENDGAPYLILRNGTNFGTSTDASETTTPSPTNRWMHNRVSRSANQSHISSYDSFNNRLYYSRGGTRMTIDGNNAQVTGGIAASTNAGNYSAIDYDSTGPVIAYYDTANDTIRLAYASTEAPAAGNWTRRNVLNTNHSLFLGSGAYVSIKVDKSNGIHLAFYNSVYQTVVYAYAASRTGDFTAYTVDNVIKGGAWTDISVDDSGNPTIVYADSARTGNYDGIRMAYKSSGNVTFTGSLRCPVTGENITGWEAMTVPANYQINDDRLNVEVWPPTNRAGGTISPNNPAGWSTAVGYASRKVAGLDEGKFRLAYFYQPAWKDYTN